MAIYLKRNNQLDANHWMTHEFFKEGYIYRLVGTIKYIGMPDTVTLRVRDKTTNTFCSWNADSNCFDVARELDR